MQDTTREVVVVGLQPRRDRHDVLDRVHYRLQLPALLLDRDHVTRLQNGRRDVVLATVEKEVPMHHYLPRLWTAGGEAHPEHHIVHPKLHEPQEILTADALHPGRTVVGAPELLLGDAVVPAGLLLLQETDAILGLPLPTPAVLT